MSIINSSNCLRSVPLQPKLGCVAHKNSEDLGEPVCTLSLTTHHGLLCLRTFRQTYSLITHHGLLCLRTFRLTPSLATQHGFLC